MIKDNVAEWTGEAPARSHKPLDAGSIPASAIMRLAYAYSNIEYRLAAFLIQ